MATRTRLGWPSRRRERRRRRASRRVGSRVHHGALLGLHEPARRLSRGVSVERPRWRVWSATASRVFGDLAPAYGDEFARVLGAARDVRVHRRRIVGPRRMAESVEDGLTSGRRRAHLQRMNAAFVVRRATLADVSTLARHRAKMFLTSTGLPTTSTSDGRRLASLLTRRFADGEYLRLARRTSRYP